MKAFQARLDELVDDMLQATNGDPTKLAEAAHMMAQAYWRVSRGEHEPDFNKLARQRR